jgi:putative membrane protein
MTHLTLIAAIASLAFASADAMANDRPAPLPNTAMTDADFVKTAATSDEFERQSGALATQRAQHKGVRELGQMLVIDHTRSTEELIRAATAAGVPVPPPTLHPGFVRKLEHLDATPPELFDRIFLQQQAEAHVDALQLMRTCYKVCDAKPLRDFAAKTARVVARHLRHVYQLQHELGAVE